MIKARQLTGSKSRADLSVLTLVYLSFIVLGLPVGALGVAWPSIRDHFGLAQETLGTLLFLNTMGYLSASFLTGQLIRRLGMGRAITLSCIIATVGFTGFAISPGWWILVFAGFIGGTGTGYVDSGVNTFVAKHYSPRIMNGVHACFGIGATLAPLLMTAILSAKMSWRWGYVIVATSWGLTALGFIMTMRFIALISEPSDGIQNKGESHAPFFDTLRIPLVWISVAVFFAYAGVEFGAGSWAYTLFTEGRGINQETAGLWVGIYWGSLTLGRVLFGVGTMTNRWSVITLVRGCILGVVVGALFLWWNPANVVSFIGLALVGFAQAPIFPLLISHTPFRLGEEHASNAIGFQIAGAGLGVATIPALIGILMRGNNYEIIAVFLVFNAIVIFLIHEVAVRLENSGKPG